MINKNPLLTAAPAADRTLPSTATAIVPKDYSCQHDQRSLRSYNIPLLRWSIRTVSGRAEIGYVKGSKEQALRVARSLAPKHGTLEVI
jgi:hypothetical protein